MDRIIKFRGKRIDCGLWVYGGLFHSELETQISDCNDICNSRIDVDIETIGQYTGVEDVEGNEIYEDDYFINLNIKGIVSFGEYRNILENGTHIGFYIDWDTNSDFHCILRKDLVFWAKKYSIQGNMFGGV